MNEDLLIKIALTGVGATLVMDSWSWIQRHALHIPTFRYPLVGRWILAMRHGTFTHRTIMTTPAARGETAVGWAAHYLTGVLFAFFLWLLAGAQWFTAPTPGPARRSQQGYSRRSRRSPLCSPRWASALPRRKRRRR
ncbi:DUF2938 family protein [Cronobacter turicensis]|uniref:DUF2938 family protein n=1 Tax=Cronobacter turicensis TaxID=413502 RepID=UPI003571550A